MIDIHTHILPGLDDGAQDIEDSLRLARAAIEEGINVIIATPHHANGVYINAARDVSRHVQTLNDRFSAEGMSLRIVSGQEIRVHDDLLEAWHRGELLTLAGSSYVLLEMPSSRIPRGMAELIHELGILGLKPIIAHPERNAEVVKHPDRLMELIELGAYTQVTTHSLLGGFGKRIKQSAWSLLKSGNIHLVSSDAHHVERRGFLLQDAYQAIERSMGEQWSQHLKQNANAVLVDNPFEAPPQLRTSAGFHIKKFYSFFFKK
ncbi:tyrosine-protein phosphatase [Paenibacillus paeoniae]|uniref:Tyrosine-protein phosphatase n=1 Tax=Paenibacillus paeoniae TaxID=2292705 RepID=A0A371P1U0_9BACL|nr:CpsB/CapC family capsule biosynthesis tyrosine phosphatase [Paenibacillus paeoniae]REK69266.1 protein tyrosine phosphatase [Paenibacillus paeoniae]